MTRVRKRRKEKYKEILKGEKKKSYWRKEEDN